MRHIDSRFKLNRTSSHRAAMLANMSVSIINYEKIKTTLVKAKFLRSYIEKLVTIGRKNTNANFRLLISRIRNEEAAKKLMKEVSVRYKDRNGGYTRIVKLGPRKGDNAEMAIIEFV